MELKKTEKLEHNLVALTIGLGKDELEAAKDQAFKKSGKNITVPGFRKGKAPRKMIEHLYGADIFLEDAINIAYPGACDKAIEEAGIEAVGKPRSVSLQELTEEGNLTFIAQVPVEPDVEVGEYKGLTVERAEVVVSDEEIQMELERMAKRNARTIIVEREAGKGDTVQIDYEGSVDGVPFQGGKAEKYDLMLGSNKFIAGFEDQLIGSKAGDERAVTVTFPENYDAKELAGKEAVFQCKVHSVSETILPELDDEFAKDVSETCETLDDLKKEIRDRLQEIKDEQEERDFEQSILNMLTESLTVEIPDEMMDTAVDSFVRDYAYQLQMRGIPFEQYLARQKIDMGTLRNMFRPSAEEQIKTRLVLKKIAELENIAVSDKEMDEEYAKMAEQYNLDVAKVKEQIPADALEMDLRISNALDFVKDHANVIKKENTPATDSTPADSTDAAPADSTDATNPADSTPAE